MANLAAPSQMARKAALFSLASTVVVVAVKLMAAWRSDSISVLAEAVQSIVDILMSGLAVATIAYAARPPDEEHPYGHGKAEVLAAAFQMLVILGTGGFILFEAYRRLQAPQPIAWDWGAGAMAYALMANLVVATYLRKVSRQTSSDALASEALHLKSDSISSAGVLAGMLLVGATGEPLLDPVVAAIFTVLAMVQAGMHLRSVIHPLMDGALPPEELGRLKGRLESHGSVRGFHNVRTRQVGSQRWIELHVMLDDNLTFVAAHDLAEQIEKELKEEFGGAIVSIHYEPHEAELAHRAREHGEA